MGIIAFGATDIGRKRKTNQDSIHLYQEKKLFVVADGMGGHNGGDIASQMSVKLFPEYIDQNFEVAPHELLKNAVKHINKSIFEHGKANIELKGMGTTISSIMFDKGLAFIANIGDSRTYLISDKKLYQLTRDHSLVQEKINLGFYDREGGKNDPQKNVLIRTVGFEEEVEVDIYQYKVQKGDLFLICSDGLHGKVSDSDILHIVNEELKTDGSLNQEDLKRTVQILIDQANANGGQDNISVILAFASHN